MCFSGWRWGWRCLRCVRWGWPVFTGLSVVIAVIVGIVEWAGLAVIALFAGACVAATRSTLSTRVRVLAWGTLVVCALVLADHAVPWINNVLVFDTVALSPSAEPYTLYWNYDKAFVGVLLFAVCVQPQRTIEWSPAITATAVIAGLTAALVAVSALTVGFVAWDPKWPVILAMWIPANLLVTCLAEETFFRGLLQAISCGSVARARFFCRSRGAICRCSRIWSGTYRRWRRVCRPRNACWHRLRRSLPCHPACRSEPPGALRPQFVKRICCCLPIPSLHWIEELCQVNGTKARISPKRQDSNNSSTGARHLSPIGKSPGSKESMMNGLQMMTTDSKQVLNRTVNGEKTLCMFY